MSLKAVFNSMKKDKGYVLKKYDQYLIDKSKESNDRAINVNSPSSADACIRASFYKRLGYEQDTSYLRPRTSRIFANGDKMHERYQEDFIDMGLLVMEEVPLRDDAYEIQGHTDGLLRVSPNRLVVLELKSANDRRFKQWKREGMPDRTKAQGMIYLYCLEKRRKQLREKYDSEKEFVADKENRMKYYANLYQHLEDGEKYSREEKIIFKQNQHDKVDSLLMQTSLEINEICFVVENKNDQDNDEVVLKRDDDIINSLLEKFEKLNEFVANEELPKRPYKYKSKRPCKWCDYKKRCWESD